MFPLDIEKIAIVGVMAFVIGFGAGFYTKTKFMEADELKTVTAAQHATAQNIEQSIDKSKGVERSVAASDESIDSIRAQVAQHMKEKIRERKTVGSTDQPQVEQSSPTHSQPSGADSDRCSWTLDRGTVGLLNAARTDATAQSTPGSDGQGQTFASVDSDSSSIDAADFLDNDLQVVKLYKELAKRHDALVDYVELITKQQVKQ